MILLEGARTPAALRDIGHARGRNRNRKSRARMAVAS